MPEGIIEVKGLSAGYPDFVIKDIDFVVSRGEFFGIIGPNGSGKTTLLKTLSGLITPIKGRIILKGKEIRDFHKKELFRIMAVVSSESPQEMMKAEEYVLLGRIPHFRRFQFFESDEDRRITMRAMELTGTIHLRKRTTHELSSGERQLLSIAKSLAQEPEILLLDEPVSHLDIAHQIEVMDLLKRLNREMGLTIIIVLHDLNLASEYCDRLLLLKDGSIYKLGLPEEVITYESVEHVYKTFVLVRENPLSKRPFVLPVPSRYINM